MQITTTPMPDGKRIRIDFAYDRDLVAAVRDIPGAKFDGRTKSWSISTRYAKRLEGLHAAKAGADAAYEALFESYRDPVRMAAGRLVDVYFDRPARTVRITPIGGTYLGAVGRIQGAKSMRSYSNKFEGYLVPAPSAEAFDVLVAALTDVVAEHRRQVEAARIDGEQRRIARQEAAERERAEKAAKAEADRLAGRGRYGTLAERAPDVGTVLRLGSEVVRITGHGKTFYLDDSSSSMGWPVGHEGERACYAYYERATDAEVVALEEREAQAERETGIRRRRAAAIKTVEDSSDRPHVGHVPEGETIWKDGRSSILGYTPSIVLTPDGWLWYVLYDGTDGAAWGDYNLGYNTRGCRHPATPELIAAIRGKDTEPR